MCCLDDVNGVYFTIQSIRLYHPEVLDQLEFIIVDNNPASANGLATARFCAEMASSGCSIQYIPYTKQQSTSTRNKVFELADTPYVLCLDCHVLLRAGALASLIKFYDDGHDHGNLLQGPLIHDTMRAVSPSWKREWIGTQQGQWDSKSIDDFDFKGAPFEIEAQGLGLFSCRKDSWLGFNKLINGFGVEEIYIHDKYKQHGKATACLPFLGWVHRFYTNTVNGTDSKRPQDSHANRFRNYIIGRLELNKPIDDLIVVYKPHLSEQEMKTIHQSVLLELQPSTNTVRVEDMSITGYNPKPTTLPTQQTPESDNSYNHVHEAVVDPGSVKEVSKFSGVHGEDPRLGEHLGATRAVVKTETATPTEGQDYNWIDNGGGDWTLQTYKSDTEAQPTPQPKAQPTPHPKAQPTPPPEAIKGVDPLMNIANHKKIAESGTTPEQITEDLTIVKRKPAEEGCCGKPGRIFKPSTISSEKRSSLKMISRPKG